MKPDPFDPLNTARQTAAEVLAAAALELFPDTLLFQGQGTSKIFFYDFLFPFSFQPEFLFQLEERMRQILKRAAPIKVLEMVPGNAASLLEHVGQPVLAEKVRDLDRALVSMVQMGEFADWCEEALLDEWDPSYAFKLVEFYPIRIGEDTLVRIIGFLEEDKQALKKAIKSAPSFAKSDHLRLIEECGLFLPMEDLGDGLWAWLPKADAVKHTLVQWWRAEHRKQNFQLMTTPSCLHVSEDEEPGFDIFLAHRAFWQKSSPAGSCKIAEISYLSSLNEKQLKNELFDSVGWISDRAHLFINDEELFQECISSLQFITKIPKILGFEFQIILYTGNVGIQKKDSKGAKGYRLLQDVLKEARLEHLIIQDPMLEMQSRIQLRMADALGRWWDGPFIGIDGSMDVKSGFSCITRSAFNSLERLVALCVERYQGRWPFWLSPEQLRIIVLSNESGNYVQAVQQKLKNAGIRFTIDDRKADPLKTRLHHALCEHVPYAVLIGDREQESNSISYRTPDSPNNEKMGVDEFINMIIELNGSNDSEFEN
ncbi:MAG: hypothetical protein JSR39_00255 [Verrucomicrobia bacterium]|nr:hypothetical protein [Verrucomicrobiota bacterium]